MTPAARLAAAIELLEQAETATRTTDSLIRDYFRTRRYAGSKDRRDITERVYGMLRRRARLIWWSTERLGFQSARSQALADLALTQGLSAAEAEQLLKSGGYGPAPLSEAEHEFIRSLENAPLNHPDMPPPTTLEFPEWLEPSLTGQWNGDLANQMAAFNQPAPVDLRVNTLKADCARALQILANDGIEAEPTPLSPVGLRLAGRPNLEQTTAFKGGFIEVQDEGSQLCALLVDAQSDDTVIDLCAGAGGKSLAIAAARKDEGQIIACDIDAERLARMPQRAKRAGARSITSHQVGSGANHGLTAYIDKADRVLIDAPCTGTGTWRRRPEARWQLTPERLAEKTAAQIALLATGASLVRPGGRLIYVTCSILRQENEDPVNAFLNSAPHFSPLPVDEVWPSAVGGPCPTTTPFLNLTPASHGTDGFFVAILARADG